MQRIKYRSADRVLNEQIVALLCECFGSQYRDYYLLQLEYLLSPSLTKILTDDEGRLSAFTQVVEYSLRIRANDCPLKVAYLYSVCTAKSHQGQGVMSEFLPEIIKEINKAGYVATFLVPAEIWLIDYYKKFGFRWQTGVVYAKAPANAIPLISPCDDAKEYLREVAQYEKKREGQRQFEEHKHTEWLPLNPMPLGWMLQSLDPKIIIPSDIPLLQPLT